MSLEGSLKTVPLPEVLHLLADTSKSGELYVAGPATRGRFWFHSGQYTGFEVGRCEKAVDALFELLRLDEGDFVFDSGVARPHDASGGDGGSRDIRPVLHEAQVRLREWEEIVAVVPSLSHLVALVTEPEQEEVHLGRDQWAMVVAVGEGRSVQSVLDARGMPEFDGCKAVKGLVDAGLATVSEPAAALVMMSEPAGQTEEAEPEEAEPEQAQPEKAEPEEGGPEEAVAPAGEQLEGVSTPGFQPSAREALSALIEGIASDPAAYAEPDLESEAESDATSSTERDDESAPVTASVGAADGLADRGPWTSSELASLEQQTGWREDEPVEASGVEVPEGPEPINRGLLLKFLSSVRS